MCPQAGEAEQSDYFSSSNLFGKTFSMVANNNNSMSAQQLSFHFYMTRLLPGQLSVKALGTKVTEVIL